MVANPKQIINSIPPEIDPEAMAPVPATYTIPQGSKPFAIPMLHIAGKVGC